MPFGLTIVVDYGLCNSDSMARALEECGAAKVERTRSPEIIAKADRIVLPGVGTFAAAMRNLREWSLLSALREKVSKGNVPFLGACLGMQLMASAGSEGASDGLVEGLDIVEGVIARLNARSAEERVPHVGWNEVRPALDCPLFKGLPESSDFYFVHSYHMLLMHEAEQAARTPYCGGFTSAVQAKGLPVFGVQFHPEKSQKPGFHLLRNFLAL